MMLSLTIICSVRGVCSLESKTRVASVEVLGSRVGKLLMILPSSRVVLVASSVLTNLVANIVSNLVANMVANLMADMEAHLMANMMASVMTLRISWISSEHMAGFDRGCMGTIDITLAIGSSVAMSKA